MDEFTFDAIGTKWSISVDDSILTDDVKKQIITEVKKFEGRFSRFLTDSEVNQFRNSNAGEYLISNDFAVLLNKADLLRTLTEGGHDPAVGQLLEKVGYNSEYDLKPSDDIDEFSLPKWTLDGKKLEIEGPISFDLGGTGKGYCIDLVANILKSFNYRYFIIDAGGDMYGTSKTDSSPWKVAIQYPGKPDMAAGIIYLHNQAVAVSDSFRRKWGEWHHIVNPKLKKPVNKIIGAVAITSNTWHADCMTSALYLSTENMYSTTAKEFGASYLVFKKDGTCVVSPNWKGELYT